MFRDQTPKVLEKAAQARGASCSIIHSASSQHHLGSSKRSSLILRPGDVVELYDKALPSDDMSNYTLHRAGFSEEAAPKGLQTGMALYNVDVLTQYLFDQIVMPETWLSLLPTLYSRSDDKSPLKSSIQTASLFLMANQTSDYTAMARARESYSRSLSLLNTQMREHDEMLEDDIICTILVLHLINVSL